MSTLQQVPPRQGRAVSLKAGQSIRINGQMIGLCHSYSAEQVDQAIFLSGSVRDYSRGIP